MAKKSTLWSLKNNAIMTPINHQPHIARKLESCYQRIYRERMIGLPMVNKQLQIHAIGFQAWQGSWLGVLSTPWFMNLMRLPGEQQNWDDLPELSQHSHEFPSGRYTFTTGVEDSIGKYQMCSLFSPMFEFANDQAATETAQQVMIALMQPAQREETASKAAKNTQARAKTEQPSLTEKIQQPISRRRLITGLFHPKDGQ